MASTKNGSKGHTKVGNTKRPSAAKTWCFTWNNYDEKSIDFLVEHLAPMAPRFVFQEEDGRPANPGGTPHLQGVVYFREKLRPMETKGFPKCIHWEGTRSWKHAVGYCRDPKKRIPDGRVIEVGVPPAPPDYFVHNLDKWPIMKDIAKRFDGWPTLGDRKIVWCWSEAANVGKSQLIRYLMDNRFAQLMGGRKQDVAAALKGARETMDYPIAVFNLCRVESNHISYSALESLKDGFMFAPKFESEGMRFPAPHVLVCANAPPESELSKDECVRFEVICVDPVEEECDSIFG